MNVPLLANNPTGTTRALEDVSIRARVRGFLTERHFEEGAYVKKDQLLFVIEEDTYKVALQSAKAKLGEAEAALQKAEKSKAREVAVAQIGVDEAQLVVSRLVEGRTRALVGRSAASREDLDKAEADRKRYEAQIAADRANSDQINSDYDVDILSAKARVDDAKATVKNAELDLGYCRMYAPFAGRIGEAKVKVGNLVGPTTPGGSDNTVLATIQQLEPMGIDVQVSSRYLERATRLIEKGLPIHVIRPGADGEEEYPYEGQCFFIDNTIDPSTSTFLVKARIPNPEMTLLPGDYLKLRVVVGHVEDGVVVPEQAVMETPAGPVVYFVDQQSKVAVQRVDAPQTYEGLRVITKGLESGVPVIVEGLQLVRPGIVVQTEPVELPRPASARSSVIPAKTGSAGPAASGKTQGDLAPPGKDVGEARPPAKTDDGAPPQRAAMPKP